MTLPYFVIEESRRGDEIRLSLTGELDVLAAASLEDRLDELALEKPVARLDLSRLDFIDSTGIRVLVRALQHARANGWELQIEPQLTVNVRRVLKLVDLDRYLLGSDANGSRPGIN